MKFNRKNLTPLAVAATLLLAILLLFSHKSGRLQDDLALQYSEEEMQARLDEAYLAVETAANEYRSRLMSRDASQKNYETQFDKQMKINTELNRTVPGAPAAYPQRPNMPRLEAECVQAGEQLNAALATLRKEILEADIHNQKRFFSLRVRDDGKEFREILQRFSDEFNIPVDWYLDGRPERSADR